jgi:hypothetical protein
MVLRMPVALVRAIQYHPTLRELLLWMEWIALEPQLCAVVTKSRLQILDLAGVSEDEAASRDSFFADGSVATRRL